MTYVALALAAAIMVTVLAFTSVIGWLTRAHARERGLLLNQIMHLSGRTWTPPPAAPPAVPDPEDGRYVVSPEQMP